MEIKFEEFENNPMIYCERIYTSLYKEDFEPKRACFSNFLADQKGYTKNSYKVPSEISTRVYKEWGDIITKWGYENNSEN